MTSRLKLFTSSTIRDSFSPKDEVMELPLKTLTLQNGCSTGDSFHLLQSTTEWTGEPPEQVEVVIRIPHGPDVRS